MSTASRSSHAFPRILAPAVALGLALSGPTALAQPAAAPRPQLAPGVEPAADFIAPQAQYVVANGTPLYKGPVYMAGSETGVALKRGERPQVLAEAQGGLWLLIGQGGKGVGYAPRSLLCPVTLCPEIKG